MPPLAVAVTRRYLRLMKMELLTRTLDVRLARHPREVAAAQALRYRVFVEEMGGDGPLVDHLGRREVDAFDAVAEHLVLIDPAEPRNLGVVGAYRLMDAAAAARAGGFYSESEFDISPLLRSGLRLLELGRSCVAPDYRGGPALHRLWQGLEAEIARRGTELLFGTASFPGTDLAALAEPLAYLHETHLAPPPLRARPREAAGLQVLPEGHRIDRRRALRAIPPLLKSYLRLGGTVGAGAYVDHAFRTTDVLVTLDLRARHRAARAPGA